MSGSAKRSITLAILASSTSAAAALMCGGRRFSISMERTKLGSVPARPITPAGVAELLGVDVATLRRALIEAG
jgi:hypothetical protein